jgi:hypothetical protein
LHAADDNQNFPIITTTNSKDLAAVYVDVLKKWTPRITLVLLPAINAKLPCALVASSLSRQLHQYPSCDLKC